MNGSLTALDMALVPAFFISYGVVGLIQLNALFGGAYIRFAVMAASVTLIAYGFRWIDFSGGCTTFYSSLICANGAQGIFGFALIWTYVSAAMLGMFLFNRSINALRNR